MPSLSARLVNLALPLLGIKRLFGEPERLSERIAKLRRQAPLRPKSKWHREFEIVEDAARGYPVVTITPKEGTQAGAPHLLYLHGGGYVMDVAAVHWDTVLRLCAMLGASATVPVYPLAPEHKAQAVLATMDGLYRELAERHGAERITIMGDSAGGGMSLALAQKLKAEGGPLPGRLVLWSPWVDATASDPAQRAVEVKDRMLAVSGLNACGQMYAGDLAISHPYVSPLFGELDGLPPMAVFSGTSDILIVDGRRLAARLRDVGAVHEYHEYDDMFHVWMLLPVPEGKRALAQTAAFIRGAPA
jgi:epsilon-lactone hydrolase